MSPLLFLFAQLLMFSLQEMISLEEKDMSGGVEDVELNCGSKKTT